MKPASPGGQRNVPWCLLAFFELRIQGPGICVELGIKLGALEGQPELPGSHLHHASRALMEDPGLRMQKRQDSEKFIVPNDRHRNGGSRGVGQLGQVEPAVVFFGVGDKPDPAVAHHPPGKPSFQNRACKVEALFRLPGPTGQDAVPDHPVGIQQKKAARLGLGRIGRELERLLQNGGQHLLLGRGLRKRNEVLYQPALGQQRRLFFSAAARSSLSAQPFGPCESPFNSTLQSENHSASMWRRSLMRLIKAPDAGYL